jgi:hypothetical protein
MNIPTMFRVLPLVVLLSAGASAGPVTIDFASSLINGPRGQTVTFVASLTNTTGAPVFLNSDSLNIAAPLTGDDIKFFLFSPLSLGPGASSGSFQIFDISIPLGAPFGLYSGSFDILGGASPAAFDPVGSADFAVNVVPEPATGSMLLLALCAGAVLLRLCPGSRAVRKLTRHH